VAALYVFLGCAGLLDCGRLFAWRHFVTRDRLRAIAGALALSAAVRGVQAAWANGEAFGGVGPLLPQTAYAAAAKPGVFLVTHVAFYGPFFLLALFHWRAVCRLVHEQGVGLTLAVLGGLLLSLNSQSRFVLNVFAMLVPFVVKAVDGLGWAARQY